MIEVDFGPAVLGALIALVLIAPTVYGLFIDRIKA